MRAIDADALKSALWENWGYNSLVAEICEFIDKQPTVDAASIVRCKDCKNWDSSTEGRYVGGWCFCEKLQFSTSPDWFCADGEAKTNEVD